MSLENLVLLSVSVGTQGRAEGKGRSIGDKKDLSIAILELRALRLSQEGWFVCGHVASL